MEFWTFISTGVGSVLFATLAMFVYTVKNFREVNPERKKRDALLPAGLVGAAALFVFIAVSPFLYAVALWTYAALTAIALCALPAYLGFRYWQDQGTYRADSTSLILSCVAAVVLGIVCGVISSFNYSFDTNLTQAFVSFDESDRARVRYPNTYDAYKCRGCVLLPRSDAPTVGVTPITQNPKVRHIELTPEAEIFDMGRYIRETGKPVTDTYHEESVEDRDRFRRAIRRELNEVTNGYSKELAEFYNPDDEAQTRRLEAFIKERVNPLLAPKGIRMTKLIKWTVN